MKINVTTTMEEGLTELVARIRQAREEVSREVAEEYLNDVENTFHEEGPGWPELSDMRKQQRGDDGHPILQDTGNLFTSFEVQEIGEGKYQVGTDVSYASLMEFGGRNEQDFEVPERSFMRSTLAKNEAKYQVLAENKTKEILGL